MNGNVISVCLECLHELVWESEDVGPNHEVRDAQILCLKKLQQPRGRRKWTIVEPGT
jgi:hypothetical protein